jgi:cytochrome c
MTKTKIVLVLMASASLTSLPAFASEELAKSKGCLNCHALDQKRVGPSYKDVAAKYAGQADAEAKLAAKIKAGGTGVWGQMPMPPNPSLSDDDAKALAQWVLGTK